VSAVQGGHIDYHALSGGGFDYVIPKGTEGATGLDLTCVPNVTRARAAGILVPGVYHVLTTHTEIADQAANALRLYKEHGAPIVLDFESPPPEKWIPPITGAWLVDRAVEFCARVEDAGLACLVYTYPYFANALPYGEALLQLCDRMLWIASYHDEKHEPGPNDEPTIPGPWVAWRAWQWSGDHGLPAPGIPQVVDHDVWNGTRDDLEAWLVGGVARPTVPVVDPGP
jgi:GH25 family lysozyme M1 (1,4-beta-N-acetylmuramidase)